MRTVKPGSDCLKGEELKGLAGRVRTRACSSARLEHCADNAGVTGSSPVKPTGQVDTGERRDAKAFWSELVGTCRSGTLKTE